MRQAREMWMGRRKRFFNKALARLVFIDETSTNTKLTKRTGWAPKGERFRTHAPFGKWQTQTFIAGLRCHGLVAPWIVNAPMNAAIFERYVETQLAPQLSPGDIVVLDNVGFHKGERAERSDLNGFNREHRDTRDKGLRGFVRRFSPGPSRHDRAEPARPHL